MLIFRGGLAVAVPVDYASQPGHVRLVDVLTATSRYRDAVKVLESNAVSWLAADVLTGAPWAQRFLNSTARLSTSEKPIDRRLAAAGLRALMHVLAGTSPQIGRRRAPPLTPAEMAQAGAAIARWRARVAALKPAERALWPSQLLIGSVPGFRPSKSHTTALKALVRRRRLRKSELTLTLASWETGLPIRRIRAAAPIADLVYG